MTLKHSKQPAAEPLAVSPQSAGPDSSLSTAGRRGNPFFAFACSSARASVLLKADKHVQHRMQSIGLIPLVCKLQHQRLP